MPAVRRCAVLGGAHVELDEAMVGQPTNLLTMAEAIECLSDFETPDAVDLNNALHTMLPEPKCVQPPNYLRSVDAAISFLPAKATWRRLTEISVSVYAASPFNAKAQVRYDGIGSTVACQMVAATLKMIAAQEAYKALKENTNAGA